MIQSGKESESNLAEAYNNRAIAYYGKKEYGRAIADNDQAIRLKPDYALAFNNGCWARTLKRLARLAISNCNEAVPLSPDEADALDSRGLTPHRAISLSGFGAS
jgi:tetratricopeptide (TPR) repeat protein